jgi:predicted nucleic acid-binding protein
VKYLIDTSALIRITRRQTDPRWYDAVDRGLIGLCQPVLVETLIGVDAMRFDRVVAGLRDTYPWVPVPDDAWSVIEAIQRDLAAVREHQGLSVADHLVIATAVRSKLIVLHDDGDFETVARVVPRLREERLTAQPA